MTIPVANDSEPRASRGFGLRVTSAEALLERSLGSVVIDDDETAADVGLSFEYGGEPRIIVTNHGPAVASMVSLCLDDDSDCSAATELAAGATLRRTVFAQSGVGVTAYVKHGESDPDPSNDGGTWLYASHFVVSPSVPRPGTTGTIFVRGTAGSVVSITSSDPAVLAVPASITIPASQVWATASFTAGKAGVAVLTAPGDSLEVHVDAAGRAFARPELPFFSQFRFGSTNNLVLDVYGVLRDGTRPSGTALFFEDGAAIGSASVIDGRAILSVPEPKIGDHRYRASYSGDARFIDSRSNESFGSTDLGVVSFQAIAVPGTADVLVLASSRHGHAPGGTVNGVALTPFSAHIASATIANAAGTTITIDYPGEPDYHAAHVTIPVEPARQRAARH